MINPPALPVPPVKVLARTAAGVLVAAGALTIPSLSHANVITGCAVSAMSSGSQPGCWHPFASASPFNTELPTGPKLAADNASVQQHMAAYGWSLNGSNTSFSLSGDGSRPVYFASPSDPVMTVHCTGIYGPSSCQGANGLGVNGAQINVPAGAQPATNGDAHMTVIETATGTEYDFWRASVSGSTLTAGTGAQVDVNTSDGRGSGGDAANLALTAGLLRPSELASGQIDHALVVTAPCTNATGKNVGYTWPASGGFGEYCGQYWNEAASNAPELGQLLKLAMTDSQIAASPAPAWEKTIMTALAHYGAYIEDTNGSYRDEGMNILTQGPASFTDVGQPNQWASVITALGGTNSTLTSTTPIPTGQLELVDTCVTQGTCPGASTNTPVGSPPITPAPTPVGAPPAPTRPTPPTQPARPASPVSSGAQRSSTNHHRRRSGPAHARNRRRAAVGRAARARRSRARHHSRRSEGHARRASVGRRR